MLQSETLKHYAIKTQDNRSIYFDWWSCERPKTRHWGSGKSLWDRMEEIFGEPSAAFGKTDGIPDQVKYFDHSNGYEWKELPFDENHFSFSYWDPPYDHLYKKEGQEIWRVSKRLAILHTHIWPRAWLKGAIREALIAVSMGPNKQLRALQVFSKSRQAELFARIT